MKTTTEIQAQITYLLSQKKASQDEKLWTAAAIYQSQIDALNWVLGQQPWQ